MEQATNDLAKKLGRCDFNSDNVCEVGDDKFCLIFFDLETSGFSPRSNEILQIAAKSSESSFDVYVRPTKPIFYKASDANHLTFTDGNLMYEGNIVDSMSIAEALRAFKEFLSSFPKRCLLLAHNANFDNSFLLTAAKEHDLLEDFERIVYGFVDTVKVFKDILPERKGNGGFELKALAKKFLTPDECDQKFHNAAYDVFILEKLSLNLMKGSFSLYITTFRDEYGRVLKNEETARWKAALKPLEGDISDYMIGKIASRGISFDQLTDVFINGGEQRFIEFLKSPDDEGKVFITKDKKVIRQIINVMKKILQRNQ